MHDTDARPKRWNAKADVCVTKVDMMKTLQPTALHKTSGFSAVIASQSSGAPANQIKVNGIWNDETVEKIKQLVGRKLTAEAIAAEISTPEVPVTRSQILGICWRRGWQVGQKRPSRNHIPKQRTIGKRILKRGQSDVQVILALPDTREPRSVEETRIVRKASTRKPSGKALLTLPLFEAAATADTKLNTSGADFIRHYKKRAEKAKAPAKVAEAIQTVVAETAPAPAPVAEVVSIPAVVNAAPVPACVLEKAAPVAEAKPERDLSKCLTIFDLRDRHCRYPVSGTGVSMLYCSEPAISGKPYCEHCASIAYEKPEKVTASNKPPKRKVSAFSMRNGIIFR
ncbi:MULTISPECIES: GcrA family cell cycle regulator [Microvirga]|uniref:GcrA family cell cycle regulator n=1 Tax=Microvirga TaxID=186650 RepID=UPI0021C8B94E|nr:MULTISPECIES: GcrA family cell cycle regulator [unclassified Microvirga]